MRRSEILAAAVAAVGFLASGCASAAVTRTSVPPAYGIVRGTVTAGPTCPVEQAGHPCPSRPVPGAVSARRADGTTWTATVARDGTYQITVPAGTYTLTVRSGSFLPTCPPGHVTVPPGSTVRANILCDTGIR